MKYTATECSPALQSLAEVDKLSPSHPLVHTLHQPPIDKAQQMRQGNHKNFLIIIPVKAFARDYGITGVCLSVYLLPR